RSSSTRPASTPSPSRSWCSGRRAACAPSGRRTLRPRPRGGRARRSASEPSPMEILQALVNGLLIGGVYAVISIGLTLVFGVMSIINFAQAEFLMLGMFIAFFCWQYLGLDPMFGALVAFAVVFAFGML